MSSRSSTGSAAPLIKILHHNPGCRPVVLRGQPPQFNLINFIYYVTTMKKIFWTTIFWLIVFFGFALYIKMFDANMAVAVSTWLGATTVTSSWEPIVATDTGAIDPVLSGINSIQTTLLDMQTKLDTLIPTSITTTSTSTTSPTSLTAPTPVVAPTPGANSPAASSTGSKK